MHTLCAQKVSQLSVLLRITNIITEYMGIASVTHANNIG